MLKMTILNSILAISASRSLLEAVKALVKRRGSALTKRELGVRWGWEVGWVGMGGGVGGWGFLIYTWPPCTSQQNTGALCTAKVN